ncbi:MAG: hypothetical protein NTZ90_14990 [Proteobacteria bacterium]|nr:hypothetical protein [Pseudomonadota bacterium]
MRWILAPLLAFCCLASVALARKTNGPIYEDPFDLGAGGASLTRASKEGVLFSNPALLPLGAAFFRWTGLTTTLLVNKESVDTARGIVKSAQSSKGSSSGSDSKTQAADLVDKVFKNPIHLGWGLALSTVTSAFGLSAFSRFEPDIRAKQFGSTGLPEVELRTESYHGVAVGTAVRTPLRWLLFGATAKYLYAGEQDIAAQVTDSETIASFGQQKFAQNLVALNKGVGLDLASLLFFQGQNVDLTAAAKVDDLGNTKLSGTSAQPKQFKQVASAGLGLTLHSTADALHFAVDYRDLSNVYKEALFKRLYVGTKVTLRTYLGFSGGYYNGYPSMGIEVDLLLLRLAFTSYTRELGDHPGVDPRHIYMASISAGF